MRIENLLKKQDALYDDKFNEVIDISTYKRIYTQVRNEIEKENDKLAEYKRKLKNLKDYKKESEELVNIVKEFLSMKHPSKEMLHKIIDKIYITSDKEIEIYYKINNNF